MCFSKINTELMVENDCSSHFNPHLVHAGVHDVFPSAPIAKKKKVSATTWCIRVKSLSLRLCVQ